MVDVVRKQWFRNGKLLNLLLGVNILFTSGAFSEQVEVKSLREEFFQLLDHTYGSKADVQRVKEMLESGAIEFINSPGKYGKRPLGYAIDIDRGRMNPSLELMELLLKNGASVDASIPGYYGYLSQTMDFATPTKIKAMELLLDYGADVNYQDEDEKRTALHTANYYDPTKSSLKAFEVLLQRGARTDLKDSKGRTVVDVLFNYHYSKEDPQWKKLAVLMLKYGVQFSTSQVKRIFPEARKVNSKDFMKIGQSIPSDQLVIVNSCGDKGGHKLHLIDDSENPKMFSHDYSSFGNRNDDEEERLCLVAYNRLKKIQESSQRVYVSFSADDAIGPRIVSADSVLDEGLLMAEAKLDSKKHVK